MSDIDQMLAARFARIEVPPGFEERLAVRLDAERARAARLDRQAAMREALAQHDWRRGAQSRALRHSVSRLLGLAGAALLLIIITRDLWRAVGGRVAAEAAVSDATSPMMLALIVVPALAGLAAALRSPRA